MKVLITNNAYNDINEFVKISKSSQKKLNSYIVSLLNYSSTLADFSEIGKQRVSLRSFFSKRPQLILSLSQIWSLKEFFMLGQRLIHNVQFVFFWNSQ